jgi:hypothetical protein
MLYRHLRFGKSLLSIEIVLIYNTDLHSNYKISLKQIFILARARIFIVYLRNSLVTTTSRKSPPTFHPVHPREDF